MTAQPARYTTSEVCAMAGYGPTTLWRRIQQGRMPKPVDRGRENLFQAREVKQALGIDPGPDRAQDDPWLKALE